MNKNFPFLVLAVAITLDSSLAQENSDQQNPGYSSIPSIAQESTAPTEAIQPYEVSIDDLVTTPWKDTLPHFSSLGSTNQTLNPLSITLEKGQNLVLHINGSKDFTCDEGYFQSDAFPGSIRNYVTTSNWGGWNNFLRQDTPLSQNGLQVSEGPSFQKNRGNSASYYFKNNHSGKSTVLFYYGLLKGHGSTPPVFNMKESTVTIK